jgi:hypothetical protein
MLTIDSPAFVGNSARRVIVEWHCGSDYRVTECQAYSTRAALEHLLAPYSPPETVIAHMVSAIATPNDAWHVRCYDLWSWVRVYQVWARDTRPASEVIASEREQDAAYDGFGRRCALSRAAHYAPDYAAVLA